MGARACGCGACVGAAAHVGGWFLAPPPSLVNFRAWVCKTAGPLECEKNSPIRILRYRRPCVRFGHRGPYPQHAPETTRETTEATAAGPVLSVLPPTRRPQRAPEAAKETAEATAAGRGHRRRADSVCPTHCQEAAGASAAGPVTFNARRDYELLEQVVSTYGR